MKMGVIKSNLGITEMLERKPVVEEEVEEEVVEEAEEEVVEDEEIEEEVTEEEEEKVEETHSFDYKELWEKEHAEKEKLLDKLTTVDKVEDQPQQPQQPAVINLLSEESLDEDTFLETVSNRSKFIKFFNEFGNNVRVKTEEAVLRTVPDIAQGIASFTISMNDMNREFFTQNPELLPMKKLVSITADELIRERKVNDLDGYQKVLADLPGVLKDKIGVDLKSVKKESKAKKKSGQVQPGGTRVSKKSLKKNLTPLQRDLAKALEFSKKNK
jgi:actin-related protein